MKKYGSLREAERARGGSSAPENYVVVRRVDDKGDGGEWSLDEEGRLKNIESNVKAVFALLHQESSRESLDEDNYNFIDGVHDYFEHTGVVSNRQFFWMAKLLKRAQPNLDFELPHVEDY